MKILFLTHAFYPDIGGIESVSEMLATEFTNQGCEVRLLTWTNREGERKFPFEIIRQPGFSQIMKAMKWADVVFENNPCLRLSWPNIFARRPIVVALHTWIQTVEGKIGMAERFKLLWLSWADKVIACSDALRKKTYPSGVTIGNPYNNILFRKIPGVEKTKDFVFLGRLVSDKGVSLAVDAFKAFIESNVQNEKSNLTIIGYGAEMAALKEQTSKLGLTDKVTFTGSMKGEALVQKLNEFRYLLVPSLWDEPFGIVVLEGMACGCLPIASNSGGLPDAVGNAGATFQQGSKESLLQIMVKLYTDAAYDTQLRAATETHLIKHQVKSVASEYLQVIKEAAEKK